MGCIVEKDVMNPIPKSILRSLGRRDTVPWLQMGVLLPIHRGCSYSSNCSEVVAAAQVVVTGVMAGL